MNVAVARFQLALPAAVAVISQLPTPARTRAPVLLFTVHTLLSLVEYDSVVSAPVGALSVGTAAPNVTEAAL